MMTPIERDYKTGLFMFESDVMRIVSCIRQAENDWIHFKIGKAGESAEERFLQEDYRNTYDGICEVYASTSKTLVDKMEAALIDHFINDPKCDNHKDGDQSINDHMKESRRYIVYVVYKNRRKLFE